MSDFERYGDYNEVSESPGKSPVLLAIKITALVLAFSVVAVILFRVCTFNYYPKDMKSVYYNDTLIAYCEANGGSASARTQKLRAPYDDPDLGNFFADHLFVIEELGQLQVTVRYNASVADTIFKNYGVEFDPDDTSRLRFRLTRSGGDENAVGAAAGEPIECTLSYSESDKFLMYRYVKLVFDGVDFDGAQWIRLDIYIDGVELKEPFMIAIYENSEGYAQFADYQLVYSEDK